MTKDYDPSPWFPETEPVKIAAIGKALEEIFELVPLLAWPAPRGREVAIEYQHLAEELADVQATLELVSRYYELDVRDERVGIAVSQEPVLNLGKVLARVLIQGIDELEPRTGVPNRTMLALHIREVYAIIDILIENPFNPIERDFVDERTNRKLAYLSKWHENMQRDLDTKEADRLLDAKAEAEYRDRD